MRRNVVNGTIEESAKFTPSLIGGVTHFTTKLVFFSYLRRYAGEPKVKGDTEEGKRIRRQAVPVWAL